MLSYKILIVESDQRCPHYIVLKLLRVLGSYDVTFCLKLRNLQLLDVLKGYLYTKQDINVRFMKNFYIK